jgi:hypothetical protein
MLWRAETLEISPSGYYGAGIGDVNNDGKNDLIYCRLSSPYYLFRRFWDDNLRTWAPETITATTGANWAFAIGDANNDGVDDIIYSSGVATNSRLYRTYWNSTFWQTEIIWNGDGRTIQGVAIGNFDHANGDSNEIVAVTSGSTTDGGRVIRLKWTAQGWDTLTLWKCPDNASFTNVAIGDFDASNIGKEIAVANGLGPGSQIRGAIIEIFGNDTTWYSRVLYTPPSPNNAWGLAIGNIYQNNPGEEIVFANSLNPPYVVRILYGIGDTWTCDSTFTIGGATYGITVGDVNRHRTINSEIAVAGNYAVYEIEEYVPG